LAGAASVSLPESPPSFALSLPPSTESTSLRFFSLSDLKSVSYQPPPFRRNDGADMSRTSVRLPQSGHFLRGGSETFCSASTSWPQDLQRYSYIGMPPFSRLPARFPWKEAAIIQNRRPAASVTARRFARQHGRTARLDPRSPRHAAASAVFR